MNLVNAQTNQVENVPEQNVQNAFLSGTHNFIAGQKIPMVDPTGQVVDIDPTEAHPALTQGNYQIAMPDQVHNADMQQAYGEGVGNELKAFGESAANTATFGGYSQLATRSGFSTPEAIKERAERNPLSNMAGIPAGIAGSLLVAPEAAGVEVAEGALRAAQATGDAAKIAEATNALHAAKTTLSAGDLLNPVSAVSKIGGKVSSSVVGLAPEEAGALTKMASRVGGAAASGAVEGALYSGGNVINEQALGDPGLNGEKILSELGLGALFGGTLGGTLGLGAEGLKLGKGLAQDTIGAATESIFGSSKIQPKVPLSEFDNLNKYGTPDTSILRASDELNMSEGDKNSLIDGLSKLKPNHEEIEQAAQDLNAPLLESQISASKHVQDMDTALQKGWTPTAIKRQQLAQQGFDAVDKAVTDSFGQLTEESKAEIGNKLKEGLVGKINEELKPIQDLYDSASKLGKEIPINPNDIKNIQDSIRGEGDLFIKPDTPEAKLAESTAKHLENIKNIDQLKMYRSALNREIGPETRFAGGLLNKKLAELEENSIINFTKENMPEMKGAADQILENRKTANAAYKSLMEKSTDVGEVLGKKKFYGPKHLLDYFESQPPEKFADRLFSKNNSEFLKQFQKEFPEEKKLLMQYQKSKLISFKDGRVELGKTLGKVNGLPKEVKNIMFSPEEINKLNAAKTYLEAFPKDFNPSGTGRAVEWARYFTNPVSSLAMTAKDFAANKTIQRLVKMGNPEDQSKIRSLMYLEQKAKATSKKIMSYASSMLSAVPEHIDSLAGKASADIANKTLNNPKDQQKQFKKRMNYIETFNQNPQLMHDHLTGSTDYIYNHAPETTTAIQQAGIRGMQFLSLKSPKVQSTGMLGSKIEPSSADITKFNRYYDAVQDPTSILKHVPAGTIMPEGIETLSTVYPRLYNEMKSTVMNRMMDYVAKHGTQSIPYKTKMGLSLFLGQPLEASLNQDSILMSQQGLQTAIAPPPVKPAMDKLSMANSIMTPAQQAAHRNSAS